jgi:hypothetical protein
LVGVGLLTAVVWNILRAEFVVALVVPVPFVAFWIAGRMFWFGMYDSDRGFVVNGFATRKIIPWDRIVEARVDVVDLGLRMGPTVVLDLEDGTSVQANAWGGTPWRIRRMTPALEGLARDINAAVLAHRTKKPV